MKYFEIKPGTKEYSLADKIYTLQNAWSDKKVIQDLEDALSRTPCGNIECNPHVLRVNEMPEGTNNQFKKNIIRGKHEAYTKSEINKKYLDVIKRHGLASYGVMEFVFDVGLFGKIKTLCPIKIKESPRYFITLKDELSSTDVEEVKTKPFLSAIKESDYLMFLASQEDAQGQASRE